LACTAIVPATENVRAILVLLNVFVFELGARTEQRNRQTDGRTDRQCSGANSQFLGATAVPADTAESAY